MSEAETNEFEYPLQELYSSVIHYQGDPDPTDDVLVRNAQRDSGSAGGVLLFFGLSSAESLEGRQRVINNFGLNSLLLIAAGAPQTFTQLGLAEAGVRRILAGVATQEATLLSSATHAARVARLTWFAEKLMARPPAPDPTPGRRK